eukprot:gb/GFBE01078844.1/.p1 GENE.gb/GFBE01078844.1/~~gb/GFBE01078844.1/.p1  ORF type:complete len:233 (+),score=54.70 gb/GFBE01078844.1/:1-699(+)
MQPNILQQTGQMMAAPKQFDWPRSASDKEVDPKEDLRGVHWALSYVPNQPSKTETKMAYIQHPSYRRQASVENGADLKASHIDLSVGESRSGKHWQSALTAEMSRNAADKFNCKQPGGFQQLGAELRKSSLSFGDRADGGSAHETEQKARYGAPPPVEQATSFADTVGKDLRASHIDIANGRDTRASHWQSMQSSEMAEFAKEKFNCRKPAGFDHLIAELRKSSVPLGGLGR